ncbi:MAG: hypothetical protein KatS3mg042_0993 [Rhodothermaceae bacterium]|nr:MAG: hypothetical protein KatS3mg042_0993 [Rhodothermaceae bacterium]
MVSSLVNVNHRNEYRLKAGADVSKAHARRVWTFRDNEHMLLALNEWLAGGSSYPFLTAFLGIAVGFISTPAGVAWSVFFAAMDNARSNLSAQCFARVADQLWMVEAVGSDDGAPVYMRQIWLVDPLRNGNSGPPASSWCIAEDRYEVAL